MSKTKPTKKELPILKRDLILEMDIFEKLVAAQQKYFKEIQEKNKLTAVDLKIKYTNRLATLEAAKNNMLKEYNAEIKKYKDLVKNLDKQQTDITKPVAKKPKR